MNICPKAIRRRLSAPHMTKPKGILSVDIFGQPADYISLREIANSNGLWLIADAAQSIGGVSQMGQVGTLADITTTSFYPTKPLGCYGDGGAIFTDIEEYANRIRSLRNHGEGSMRYLHYEIGMCSRLDTLQAATLLAKLDIFDDELEKRNHIADFYNRNLKNFVSTPVLHAATMNSSWAQYTIQLHDQEGKTITELKDIRSRVVENLIGNGIPVRVYYSPALHKQFPYINYPKNDLGNTEYVSAASISLPLHPYLSEKEVAYITSQVKSEVCKI